MISTVTTSTVSTITSVTSSAIPGLSASLALVAIVLLLVLLIQKEMVSGNQDGWGRQLSRGLNVGIVPLFMAFVLILGHRIMETFR